MIPEYKTKYQEWLSSEAVPQDLKEELSLLTDEVEKEDRFYCDLNFGTAGLRGIIAAGTNRMNVLTVATTTRGIAEYLKDKVMTEIGAPCYDSVVEEGQRPSVCIAFDTRNKSREFALVAASILSSKGIKAYLYENVRPTPMLSFAVRHLKANAGIIITASHNPADYNGYKVYNSYGGQITDADAQEILSYIGKQNVLTPIPVCEMNTKDETGSFIQGNDELIKIIGKEIDEEYYRRAESLCHRKDLIKKSGSSLNILYTPLNGTGSLPVRHVLSELGFGNVSVVKEQAEPDGNFTTVPKPNPEEIGVYEYAIKQSENSSEPAAIIIATDPDCDRIGVVEKDAEGKYEVFSGNQMGALLCDYMIKTMKEYGVQKAHPAVIKTIVSSDFINEMCAENSVEVCETLTGFKYIAELIESWENPDFMISNKQNKNISQKKDFLFGFEESYGYLVGSIVRDKDAVTAAEMVSEMALYYRESGKSLHDALNQLYEKYGYFDDRLISVSMPGKEGKEQIKEIMAEYRRIASSISSNECYSKEKAADNNSSDECSSPVSAEDYSEGIKGMPKSDVLKFRYADGAWTAFRPSGTEPKLKVYIGVKAKTAGDACDRLDEIEASVRKTIAEIQNGKK